MKRKNTSQRIHQIKVALLLFFVIVLPFAGNQPQPVQATAGTVCHNCVFLPSLTRTTASDLTLRSIEVTQAVQDEQNSVPLVSGRRTVVRIYAVASGFPQPVENVEVSVTASRLGTNTPIEHTSLVTTVPLSDSRSDYRSTINVTLPESWLTGALDLTVTIDPENKLAELDESNNVIIQHLNFNPVPTLRVMIVPVEYTHTVNGHTYVAPTKDSISDWITRTYPISKVEISWHAPYTFTGNLTSVNDFSRLLSEVTTLMFSENAPSDQIYYGLVPTHDSDSTWFSAGIAGIGWIGLRTAIGLDYLGSASQIAAHEIGHNLGMSHTPCGVSGDPNYPYANGAIGQYGLDLQTGNIYNPTDSKDLMSYCNPKWISDYTYKFLLNSQTATSATNRAEASLNQIQSAANRDGSVSRSLFVRAQISANGAQLLPSYVLTGQMARQSQGGDYQVQVLNGKGAVIASADARAYQTGEESAPEYGINTMIALPDQTAASVRLLKDGQLLAEQTLQTSQPASTQMMRGTDGSSINWNASSQPALVRYSPDGGKTWTTLSVDAKNGHAKIPAGLLSNKNAAFDVVMAGSW